MSSSGKTTDFDSVIRRFKSCHPSHPNEYDPLAQSVEHMTFNHGVRSSNLRWVTNIDYIFSFARYAPVAELADASDLGSDGKPYEFKSLRAHHKTSLREWLSGRALPCQGKCRGSESRLPLQKMTVILIQNCSHFFIHYGVMVYHHAFSVY